MKKEPTELLDTVVRRKQEERTYPKQQEHGSRAYIAKEELT